jgi:glycosyltransferase involved in cell wall biosynthesis
VFRACAVIPTYENPETIGAVVERVRRHLDDVIVVDDGSSETGRGIVAGLGEAGRARVIRRERNGGKGAAVKTGFAVADDLGFTHVLQVDADGQHDLDDIPRFLTEARERPEALILGRPVFDATQPKGRAFARQISTFWVNVETGGGVIADPQCGFRVYPLAAALAVAPRGDHMEFDQELPVRMVWGGTPVVNLPTRVRYLAPEEGGISHYDVVRDTLRITRLHVALVATRLGQKLLGRDGRRRG